jgi:hypothetical protein
MQVAAIAISILTPFPTRLTIEFLFLKKYFVKHNVIFVKETFVAGSQSSGTITKEVV